MAVQMKCSQLLYCGIVYMLFDVCIICSQLWGILSIIFLKYDLEYFTVIYTTIIYHLEYFTVIQYCNIHMYIYTYNTKDNKLLP